MKLQKEKSSTKNCRTNPRGGVGRKIRNLQAGEERRGSCASHSRGCCLDPSVVEHFLTVGTAQAMQHFAYPE